jgi:hypothetical protein
MSCLASYDDDDMILQLQFFVQFSLQRIVHQNMKI